MRRLSRACVIALGLLGCVAVEPAAAQFYPSYPSYTTPYGRRNPALNPYLNLTRGGNPAANYFLGVLPELDRRAVTQQQGAVLLDLERRIQAPAALEDLGERVPEGALPPTGHAAVFANYSTYYSMPSLPGQSATTRQPLQPRGR